MTIAKIVFLSLLITTSIACQSNMQFQDNPTYIKGKSSNELLQSEFVLKISADSIYILEYKNGFHAVWSKGFIEQTNPEQLTINIHQQSKYSLNTGLNIYPWRIVNNINYQLFVSKTGEYSIQKIYEGKIDSSFRIDDLRIIDRLNYNEKIFF